MTANRPACALLASLALCACAGGGQEAVKITYGPSTPRPEPVDHGCGTVPGYDIQCVPLRPNFPDDFVYGSGGGGGGTWKPAPTVNFGTWSSASRTVDQDTTFRFDYTRTDVHYARDAAGAIDYVQDPATESGSLYAKLFENGEYVGLRKTDSLPLTPWTFGRTVLQPLGQPGIEVVWERGDRDPFTTREANNIVVRAIPSVESWSYQSFGVWNDANLNYPRTSAVSFGSATPAASIPAVGSATFTGKLGGLYVSPSGQGSVATANVTVNADFGARSLSFASSGTTLTRDLGSATAAPSLDIRGTLTYSPGSNSFSGTLATAGGSLSGASKGQFYGPVAQEAGGTFALKSPGTVETLTGAYGARRW